MGNKSDRFISEVFYTKDERFAFHKVGRHYNLYCRDNDWWFTEEFTSFHAMQEYINEVRNKDGVRQETV